MFKGMAAGVYYLRDAFVNSEMTETDILYTADYRVIRLYSPRYHANPERIDK
jgi:hypothetical protein